jgi:hypothetical protein
MDSYEAYNTCEQLLTKIIQLHQREIERVNPANDGISRYLNSKEWGRDLLFLMELMENRLPNYIADNENLSNKDTQQLTEIKNLYELIDENQNMGRGSKKNKSNKKNKRNKKNKKKISNKRNKTLTSK